MATATYADGDLVVTVPKGAAPDDDGDGAAAAMLGGSGALDLRARRRPPSFDVSTSFPSAPSTAIATTHRGRRRQRGINLSLPHFSSKLLASGGRPPPMGQRRRGRAARRAGEGERRERDSAYEGERRGRDSAGEGERRGWDSTGVGSGSAGEGAGTRPARTSSTAGTRPAALPRDGPAVAAAAASQPPDLLSTRRTPCQERRERDEKGREEGKRKLTWTF
uniref:Uncharacterized protein n=1 Tax=Oryza meridionalis TaxID=40149 RepID=A0A0E0CUR9_9ORYZ